MPNYPTGPKGAVVSKFTGSLETNSHKQGRSSAKVGMKPGPATGRGSGNPVSGGGINRATRGKK